MLTFEVFMHLSIKILLAAIVLVIFGYYTIILIKYLRGKFQFSALIPGRYLLPKRITSDIRPSVISIYKTAKSSYLAKLEEELDKHQASLKLTTTDNSMSSQEFFKYRNAIGEDNFRYFLYIYEASVICGLLPSPGKLTQQEIAMCKIHIRRLNELVMTKYLKRFISNTDRSIILAEIMYRVTRDISPKMVTMPYNFDFYNVISRDTIIAKHSGIITEASFDNEVQHLIHEMVVKTNPIYNFSGRIPSAAFIIKVCLLTNWIKT